MDKTIFWVAPGHIAPHFAVDCAGKKAQLIEINRKKGIVSCGLFRRKGTITPRKANNGEGSNQLKTFLNKNTL